MAIASNLFSSDVLNKPDLSTSNLQDAEGAYLEMRSLIAKRSVVEGSFNAIVGMKSMGPDDSQDPAPRTVLYTMNIIKQLGVTSDGAALNLISGTNDNLSKNEPSMRPSYYALMETLAQKIYEDDQFYSNLYDTPANVLRKSVAMRAINLMLERDMHKSELRSEMDLSVWLELELMKYQKETQNRLNALAEKFEKN